MAHARTTIRKAFIALLKGKTIAGNNVYDSSLYIINEASLPAIIVFSTNEEVVTNTISPPRAQERTLRITAECYAKATNEVNVIADNLALRVEELVAADIALKQLCKDCKLESTELKLNSDGDQPVAVASLTFSVIYRTKENAPEVII